MGKDTVYRIEERRHPHKAAIDFINDVFNPLEKVEKLISGFREEQEQLAYAIEEKLNSTPTRTWSTLQTDLNLNLKGTSRSRVSSNTQSMSKNNQKSPSYDDVTPSYNDDGPPSKDDIRHGVATLASDMGQNGTVGVSQEERDHECKTTVSRVLKTMREKEEEAATAEATAPEAASPCQCSLFWYSVLLQALS
jgi:hypothetical protein